MFDIGFWEMALIAVIGIVVVGPDKLPEVVRSVMVVLRKAQRMFSDVRGDIERELHLDEVRRSVDEMDLQAHIRKLNQSVIDADQEIRGEGKKILHDLDAEVKAVEKSLQDIAEARAAEAPQPGGRISRYPDPETQRDTGIEQIAAEPPAPPSETDANPK